MAYSQSVLIVLIFCSLCSNAMESIEVVSNQEDKNTSVPSLYSYALKVLTKKLVAEDTLDASMVYGDSEHSSIDSFDLAEQISKGEWLKIVKDKDEVREILLKEYWSLYVDIFSSHNEPIVLENEPNERDQHIVGALAVSPDGKKLAVLTSQVTIWDLENLPHIGKPVVLEGPRIPCHEGALRWSEDGAKLYTCRKGKLIYWDVTTGKIIFRHDLPEMRRHLMCCTFSPDGSYLLDTLLGPISGLPNGTKPWLASSLKGTLYDLREVVYEGHEEDILDDEEVKVQKTLLAEHKKNWCVRENTIGNRLFVCFSPDGRYAITAGCDFTARLHDLSDWPDIKSVVLKHKGLVCSAAISPNGKKIITLTKEYVKKDYGEKGTVNTHSAGLYMWDLELVSSDQQKPESACKKLNEFVLEEFTYFHRKGISSQGRNYGYPTDLAFDGRFLLFQVTYLKDEISKDNYRLNGKYLTRTEDGYRTYLYDVEKNYGGVIYESKESMGKFAIMPGGSYAIVGSHRNNNVYFYSLREPFSSFDFSQLLVLAKLRDVLRNDLPKKALKILESFPSQENNDLQELVMKYFEL